MQSHFLVTPGSLNKGQHLNAHVTVRKPKHIKQFMAKKTMAKYKTMFSLQGKPSVKPISNCSHLNQMAC